MPNIFDQFDEPTATVTPDGKNPFDQFDEPSPLKFASLPGNLKLNPLQQVLMQREGRMDPELEGATAGNFIYGNDDVFLQAAPHAITRDIGFGMNFLGQALKGDTEAALFNMVGQKELANQQLIATAGNMNPAWKQKDEDLGIDTSDPYEEARETLPAVERMASGIGPGLIQSAPQLALSALQPELGAASFGFTPNGFDPVQAAAAMIAPAGGKMMGGLAERLATKAGISNDQALDVINQLGGGAGVAGLISAPTAYQIAQMQPGKERDEAIQDAASNAILTGILGSIGAAGPLFKSSAATDGALLQPYGGPGGGHHVPAREVFTGAPLYRVNWAPAIPNAELRRLGVNHTLISTAQQKLYREFAKTGRTLTWDDISAIETEALVSGGMTREMAEATVRKANRMLRKSGVINPTKTPWGKINYAKSRS